MADGGSAVGGGRGRLASWLDDLGYELRRSRPEVVVRLPLVKGESNGEEEMEECGRGYCESGGMALMPDRLRTDRLADC